MSVKDGALTGSVDSGEKCALIISAKQGALDDEELKLAEVHSFGNYPPEDTLTCLCCENQVDCMTASGKV